MRLSIACSLGALMLAGVATPASPQSAAAPELTHNELYDRCLDDGKKYSLDDQIIGCTGLIDSNPQLAYYFRGEAYKSKRQYDLAISDFDAVIRLNPSDGDAYLARANAYDALGQSDRAQADWDKARELDPDDDSDQ